MKLTHVCIWKENEWRPISAEKAAREYKRGVNAQSGIFHCSLCGKNVLLAYGSVNIPHFRHSSGDDDKNCPERTLNLGAGQPTHTNPRTLPLPIRFIVDGSHVRFELGLIAPPEGILDANLDKRVSITNIAEQKSYQYLIERIHPDGVTYLPVGSIPSPRYSIDLSDVDNNLKVSWPSFAEGIKGDLVLFDGETRKKLPEYADVVVNRKYIALSTFQVSEQLGNVSLIKEQKLSKYRYVYSLTITHYSLQTANYLLEYHYRLTEKPAAMTPLWPPAVCSPYVVYHQQPDLYVHTEGLSITMECYPHTSRETIETDEGKIIKLKLGTSTPRQLVSIGRNTTLRFMYLWYRNLNMTAAVPNITVTNAKGEAVTEEIIYNHCELYIKPDIDLIVQINDSGRVISRYRVDAEKTSYVSLKPGQQIRLLAGNDLLRMIECRVPERSHEGIQDEVLLQRLKQLKFQDNKPYRSGAVLEKLRNYPKTKQWLSKQIRQGKADKRMVEEIRRIINGRLL